MKMMSTSSMKTDDLTPPDHFQAIANTAGFHFAWVE